MSRLTQICNINILFLVIYSFLISLSFEAFPFCFDHAECTQTTKLDGDNILCYGYESCKYQIIHSTDKNNGVNCYGYRSCEQIKSIRVDISSAGHVTCSGENSCENAHIYANGNVNCYGRLSCANTYLKSSNDNILCSGPSACGVGTIIEAPNGEVICDGSYGCAQVNTINAGASIYCTGLNGCWNANIIQTNEDIHCDGSYSCSKIASISATNAYITGNFGGTETLFEITGHVYCSGFNACENSLIIASDVSCEGYNGCRGAELTAQYISAVGAASLQSAKIYNPEHISFSVYAYGINASSEAEVYCRDCDVHCAGSGCRNMHIYFEDNARMTIYPPDCQRNSNRVVDGTYCPTFHF